MDVARPGWAGTHLVTLLSCLSSTKSESWHVLSFTQMKPPVRRACRSCVPESVTPEDQTTGHRGAHRQTTTCAHTHTHLFAHAEKAQQVHIMEVPDAPLHPHHVVRARRRPEILRGNKTLLAEAHPLSTRGMEEVKEHAFCHAACVR
jgi:hypothetical protein